MLIVLYLAVGFLVATAVLAVGYADDFYLDEMETLFVFVMCVLFWIFVLPIALSMVGARALGNKIIEWREQNEKDGTK